MVTRSPASAWSARTDSIAATPPPATRTRRGRAAVERGRVMVRMTVWPAAPHAIGEAPCRRCGFPAGRTRRRFGRRGPRPDVAWSHAHECPDRRRRSRRSGSCARPPSDRRRPGRDHRPRPRERLPLPPAERPVAVCRRRRDVLPARAHRRRRRLHAPARPARPRRCRGAHDPDRARRTAPPTTCCSSPRAPGRSRRSSSAVAFTGSPTDQERLHGIVQDVEGGYLRSLAFVVPDGSTWPLPLYELALMLAERAYDMGAELELHLVTRRRRRSRSSAPKRRARSPSCSPMPVSSCTPASTPSPSARDDCGLPGRHPRGPARRDACHDLQARRSPGSRPTPTDSSSPTPTAACRACPTSTPPATHRLPDQAGRHRLPAGRRGRGRHCRPRGRAARAGAVSSGAARDAADRAQRALHASRRRRRHGRRSRALVAADQDRRAASWPATSRASTSRPSARRGSRSTSRSARPARAATKC